MNGVEGRASPRRRQRLPRRGQLERHRRRVHHGGDPDGVVHRVLGEAALEHVMRDQWRQLMAASGGKEPRRGILDARLNSLAHDYDYILVDCPTALGEVTLNALEAVDLVISPLDLEMPGNAQSAVDLEEQLARTTRRPAVRFVGNKWSAAKEQRRLAWAEAERVCGENLVRAFRIPDVEAIKKAIFHGKGIDRFGGTGPGAEASQAFFDLAMEVTAFFERRQAVGGSR